ncbi:MAG: hypothetical protein U0U66_12960 [Cytophagaceae bacterium]
MISFLIRFFFILILVFSCQIHCPEVIKPIIPFDFSKTVVTKPGFSYYFDAIDFPTNQVGYISGINGVILKTTDGGNNFYVNNLLSIFQIRDIDFLNENFGVAAGSDKKIFITENGATSWTNVAIPDSAVDIDRVIVISPNEFYLMGGNYRNYGVVYHTLNQGTTWNNIFTPLGNFAYDLEMLSNGKWIVPTGNSKIWYSLNKGASWQESTIEWDGSDTTNILLGDIKMINNDIGYSCGANQSATESFVLKTTDGGLNWKKLNIPSTPNLEKDYFFSIYTLNDKEVFVAGGLFISNTSRLMYSPDAGLTWQIDSTFLNSKYIKEIVVKNGVLYGVGQNGLLFSK